MKSPDHKRIRRDPPNHFLAQLHRERVKRREAKSDDETLARSLQNKWQDEEANNTQQIITKSASARDADLARTLQEEWRREEEVAMRADRAFAEALQRSESKSSQSPARGLASISFGPLPALEAEPRCHQILNVADLLRQALNAEKRKLYTSCVTSSGVAFFGPSRNDCGWRNLQLMLSVAIAECPDTQLGRTVPNVASLRLLLERAWRCGFDEVGASHFIGRSKDAWIGPGEMLSVMRSIGLQSGVVDFEAKSTATGRHDALVAFVWLYFTRGLPEALNAARAAEPSSSRESSASSCVTTAAVKLLVYLRSSRECSDHSQAPLT